MVIILTIFKYIFDNLNLILGFASIKEEFEQIKIEKDQKLAPTQSNQGESFYSNS